MHILIIGAGISGAATALRLVREGHRVEVVEAQAEPAWGASHANAGLVSPGHCFSWAEPGVRGMVLRSALGIGDGIGVAQPWRPALWRWAYLFAREATPDRWRTNSAAALSLSAYSRDLLVADTTIPLQAYGGQRAGILYLRSGGSAHSADEAALLHAAAEPFQVLQGQDLLDREPLAGQARLGFQSGVFCPQDSTGNAALYTRAALAEAVSLGASLHCSEPVQQLLVQQNRITAVQTTHRRITPDAVVATAGLASAALLRPLGYRLPIYPMSGYSLTYEHFRGTRPRQAGVSAEHKIAWTPLGDTTLRFTGFADVGVPGPRAAAARFRALTAFAEQLCPDTAGQQPRHWMGQRPMTPDGNPFIGASRHHNLWLNCGHGAMGWTMACGSAALLADLLQGHQPQIDATPFRSDRYR